MTMHTPPETDRDALDTTWGFTRAHRIGIAMLAGILLLLLMVRYIRHPARLDDPVVIVDGRALGIDPRVDPNTADAKMLASLPLVTGKMAEEIVRYRAAQAQSSGDPVVFRTLADLGRVKVAEKAIPKATLEAMRPYLKLIDEPEPVKNGLTPPKRIDPDSQAPDGEN